MSMHQHETSVLLGSSMGVLTAAIPDTVVDLVTKVVTGVAVALITGLVHGLAKRWMERGKR